MRVRAAVQPTIRPRLLGASAVLVAEVADVAVAHPRGNALAVRAALGTIRHALVVAVQSVARVAIARIRRDAFAVRAIARTGWGALFARVDGVARLAGAGTGRDAVAVLAAQRALRHASARGGVEGEAWAALADPGRDALAVGAPSRALGHAFAGGVEGEAWLALADPGRDALAVNATSRALGDARVASVENVVRLALANARRDAFAVRAARGTIGDTVLGVVSRVDESERENSPRLVISIRASMTDVSSIDLPFVTSAHPGSCAFSVTATVFAHRHAFRVGSLHPWLELVAWPALAHVRRHALAVHAPTGADGLALPVHLLVAQLASAHVRREAVGVLLASLLAVRPADALLSDPSWRAAAHVRRCAVPSQASLGADRVAGTGAALVTVATIQNRYPPTFLWKEEKEKGKVVRNYSV